MFLKELRIILEEIKKNTSLKEFFIDDSIKIKENFKFEINPNFSNDIIFKEDTYLELGGPNNASTSIILPTNDEADLKNIINNKITLIGPNIRESKENNLDFGQIFIMGGKNILEISLKDLDRKTRLINYLEGYMIKATPRKLWTRVSKSIVEKGFDFEALGKAFFILLKESIPEIEVMEIIFITSNKDDIKKFDNFNSLIYKKYGVSKTIQYLEKYQELVKKREDCGFEWDCNTCDYTSICDEIDDLIARMKKFRKNN
ncbi:MAG: hypothetical protein EAX96_17600 [Candidatus Lokiarchaeota archaeon]|nr:hypothetical protein [Candidatus Lokiarchaeota archaeon]